MFRFEVLVPHTMLVSGLDPHWGNLVEKAVSKARGKVSMRPQEKKL